VKPRTGQVFVANAPRCHPRRLVLVFATSPSFAQVALTHSFPELATDHDLILPPTCTGLPYILVVQTDLVTPLLPSQLVARLAFLPSSVSNACLPGADLTPYARGLPLQGRQDARWAFKLEELACLHALGAKALLRLLG
jgi:hypothetical protein